MVADTLPSPGHQIEYTKFLSECRILSLYHVLGLKLRVVFCPDKKEV